jgi:DNA-binding CsgD family transcriptional regulator
MTARDALRSVRYEDQHQLPLARLQILYALAADGPAAGLAAASQAMDRFELGGSSPRYAWPVVVAGASAVLAGARLAGLARDERLHTESAGVADRLRTVAEKLGTFGPAQRAFSVTFAAADGDAARLIAAFPGAGHGNDVDEAAGTAASTAEPAAAAAAAATAAAAAAALAAWDEAAEAWDGLGEPYPLAESLLHAAEAALACGDRDGAAERLRRAAALAAALGAQPLGEQIAILARRARIRLGRDDGAGVASVAWPGDGELGLTERELEVLRLVAAGRSNRDIAGELFISPKTASVHVSNILGKLGVASRGEAAAKAHSLRLFDPAGGG